MKVKRLEVIVKEDGEVAINKNELGLYVDEKEIKDIIKKEIVKRTKEIDVENIIDLNLDNMVEENVNEEMRKRLEPDGELERLISDVAKEETYEWINNNIKQEELIDILKEAMVEKLKEFSFEKIKEIMNNIK
jgi:hypothetical protein